MQPGIPECMAACAAEQSGAPGRGDVPEHYSALMQAFLSDEAFPVAGASGEAAEETYGEE
jgi:hypothetical protein